MKKIALGLVTGALGMVLWACSNSGNSIADTSIGLRNIDLQDEKSLVLPNYEFPEVAAGESTTIERAFETAPPMIPHAIDDFLPITQDNNQCLGCHDPAVAADIGAVPVPASHTHDLTTKKPTSLKGAVAPARFNCVLCHTPQSNAQPVVSNTFSPSFRSDKDKSSSNLLDKLKEGI